MKVTKVSQFLLVVLFTIALGSVAFASDATGSFSKTLTVTGSPEVEISTGSGDITVHAGDASTVIVHAKIKANDSWFGGGLSAQEKVKRIEANPPIQQNGSTITIGRIQDRELRQNVSISYDVTVPTATRLRSETGSGDESIQDIRGPVKANSGSGNLKISKIGDEVRVNTGSGEVHVDNVKGNLYANTGSGNIKATGVAGGFYAETGSGDVTLEQDAPGHVLAKTGSGHVKLQNVKGGVEARTGSGGVEAQGEAKGDWDIHTGSGDIVLRLPSESAFSVDARSSSGGVTVNHPLTIQGTVKRNRIQGKVGAGGPVLSLETGSGDIRVE